jgi:hypothetical protein
MVRCAALLLMLLLGAATVTGCSEPEGPAHPIPEIPPSNPDASRTPAPPG